MFSSGFRMIFPPLYPQLYVLKTKNEKMKRNEFLKFAAMSMGTVIMLPGVAWSMTDDKPHRKGKARVIKNGEGKQVNVIGDQMTFKITGEDTNGLYALVEQHNEPGIGIPMHYHENEDEVFRVIEGQIELAVAGKSWVLGPGDVGFCPRGVPHTWRVTGNKKARVDLGFFPAGMEKMFIELAGLPQGPPDLGKVKEICGRYGVRFV
jgi:quercetin dioxygenase-like cupin family protein